MCKTFLIFSTFLADVIKDLRVLTVIIKDSRVLTVIRDRVEVSSAEASVQRAQERNRASMGPQPRILLILNF